MNYYKHHIGDYRRDTAHLSLLEHGIYRQLMDTYYLSEEAIPSETEQVMRRLAARTKEEREAVNMVLAEFFSLVDGAWKHARCDQEIADYHKRAEASATNGKQGGRPPGKPKKTKPVIARVPNGKATTNHEPVTSKEPPIPPKGGFEVPEWVPEKPWAEFVAMRRAKGNRVPFTVAAAKGIVAKLDEFRATGHDVGKVLEESVINGWSSVFEPKARAASQASVLAGAV